MPKVIKSHYEDAHVNEPDPEGDKRSAQKKRREEYRKRLDNIFDEDVWDADYIYDPNNLPEHKKKKDLFFTNRQVRWLEFTVDVWQGEYARGKEAQVAEEQRIYDRYVKLYPKDVYRSHHWDGNAVYPFVPSRRSDAPTLRQRVDDWLWRHRHDGVGIIPRS